MSAALGMLLACNLLLGCLLAVVAALARRAGAGPRVVHALWLVVLLKLVTPPLIPFEVGLSEWGQPLRNATEEQGPATRGSSADVPRLALGRLGERSLGGAPRTRPAAPAAGSGSPVSESPLQPARHGRHPLDLDWTRLALGLWLLGALAQLLRAALQHGRLTRSLRRGARVAPAPDEASLALVASISARLGLRRAPRTLALPLGPGPLTLVGPRGAWLVLPREWLGRAPRGAQRTVIAHELAHVALGHAWTRIFELAVHALFWWFPLVWVARRGLRAAEEEACDALALSLFPEDAVDFAGALVAATAEPARDVSGFSMALSGGDALERRIRAVLRPGGPGKRRSVVHALAVGIALAAVPLTAAPKAWSAAPVAPLGSAPIAPLSTPPIAPPRGGAADLPAPTRSTAAPELRPHARGAAPDHAELTDAELLEHLGLSDLDALDGAPEVRHQRLQGDADALLARLHALGFESATFGPETVLDPGEDSAARFESKLRDAGSKTRRSAPQPSPQPATLSTALLELELALHALDRDLLELLLDAESSLDAALALVSPGLLAALVDCDLDALLARLTEGSPASTRAFVDAVDLPHLIAAAATASAAPQAAPSEALEVLEVLIARALGLELRRLDTRRRESLADLRQGVTEGAEALRSHQRGDLEPHLRRLLDRVRGEVHPATALLIDEAQLDELLQPAAAPPPAAR